jgi:hypothetical protein
VEPALPFAGFGCLRRRPGMTRNTGACGLRRAILCPEPLPYRPGPRPFRRGVAAALQTGKRPVCRRRCPVSPDSGLRHHHAAGGWPATGRVAETPQGVPFRRGRTFFRGAAPAALPPLSPARALS